MQNTKSIHRDFPGGPVVKNLPSNAGDAGSIPGWKIKIPHAEWQLNPRATTREPTRSTAHAPKLEKPPTLQLKKAHTPQRRPSAAKNNNNLKIFCNCFKISFVVCQNCFRPLY